MKINYSFQINSENVLSQKIDKMKTRTEVSSSFIRFNINKNLSQEFLRIFYTPEIITGPMV